MPFCNPHVTLHEPLPSKLEQIRIAKRFLKLTSTPDGWWQQALDAGPAQTGRKNVGPLGL
jgi:hypothetical protein